MGEIVPGGEWGKQVDVCKAPGRLTTGTTTVVRTAVVPRSQGLWWEGQPRWGQARLQFHFPSHVSAVLLPQHPSQTSNTSAQGTVSPQQGEPRSCRGSGAEPVGSGLGADQPHRTLPLGTHLSLSHLCLTHLCHICLCLSRLNSHTYATHTCASYTPVPLTHLCHTHLCLSRLNSHTYATHTCASYTPVPHTHLCLSHTCAIHSCAIHTCAIHTCASHVCASHTPVPHTPVPLTHLCHTCLRLSRLNSHTCATHTCASHTPVPHTHLCLTHTPVSPIHREPASHLPEVMSGGEMRGRWTCHIPRPAAGGSFSGRGWEMRGWVGGPSPELPPAK